MRSIALIKDGKIIPLKTQVIGINNFEIFLKGCQEHIGFEEDMTDEGLYAIVHQNEIIDVLNEYIDKFDIEFEEGDVNKIKVEALCIFEIPEGERFDSLSPDHFIGLVQKKGKESVMRALGNLERWFKEKKPDISETARKIIDGLQNSNDWQDIQDK